MKTLSPSALIITMFMSGMAWAASPHFVGRVTSDILLQAGGDTGSLEVCFKEAGLGKNQNINYIASANASATYQCVNSGGNCPAAANKQDVSGPVTHSDSLSSGKNGSISGCVRVSPPESTLSCPNGQDLVLSAISYTDIKIEDDTNGIEKDATPSSQSEPNLFSCQ
jgi:hypothetical protein